MILDETQLESGSTIHADVIIIGAGAAGIPLAMELTSQGRRVLVIESGHLTTKHAPVDLSQGSVLDPRHGPLDQYRSRAFGGTTTVWGGRCAPLDALDFQHRSHLNISGWPLQYEDIARYYTRAHEYLELGEFQYSTPPPNVNVVSLPSFRSDQFWRYSPPTNLGKNYYHYFENSDHTDLLLRTTCVQLKLSEYENSIDHCVLRTLDGKEFRGHAKYIVLAGGGLEVTRLLMVSKTQAHPNGLGNSSGALGRYYASHLAGSIGPFKWIGPKRLDGLRYEKSLDGVYIRRALSLRTETQIDSQLINIRFIVSPPPLSDPSHKDSVLSAAFLSKRFILRLIPPEYDGAFGHSGATALTLAHLQNVATGIPRLANFLPSWISKRVLAKRKLPSMEPQTESTFYLHFDAEQTPLWDSRITLDASCDRLEMPKLIVDWKVSPKDIDSIATSCRLLIKELQEQDIATYGGVVNSLGSAIESHLGVGSHHIGTARMSIHQEHGVVDENCKVFGISNLYVSSSATFPTTGVANPTLTIVALSLKIGETIDNLLS